MSKSPSDFVRLRKKKDTEAAPQQEEQKTVKKSYDYKDLYVSVDPKDQAIAEQSASKIWVSMINDAMVHLELGNTADIHFGPQILTLMKRGEGLYNGFLKDADGQIVEQLEDQTAEMVVAQLEVKKLLPSLPGLGATPESNSPHPDEAEDRKIAEEVAEAVVERKLSEKDGVAYLRIKTKDFEFELRKSVQEFIQDFKKLKSTNLTEVRHAIKSWRRNMAKSLHSSNDLEAARELLGNWDKHQESFNQILFATKQLKKHEK